MASNKILVYQYNTGVITVTVDGINDVTGYVPVMTVKRKESDTTQLLSNTGVVTDPCTLTFSLTPGDTSIAPGDYVFDINIQLDTSVYTITKDIFTILDGVLH